MEAQLAGVSRVDCRDGAALALACESIEAHGYAILDNLLPAGRLAALQDEFTRHHARYLLDVERTDTLKVGHRRYRIPIAFSGGFADPEIYGHPLVMAVVRRLLGDDAILEAFGGVVSLGHSLAQHDHRDGPLLFDDASPAHLPCHAMTFALPLVSMDEWIGTTALWRASHHWGDAPPAASLKDIPEIRVGSALLWDFRTWHSGTPNYSDDIRPMVYATYARAWYRDPTGFLRPGLVRLDLDSDFLRDVPEDRRALFAHLRAAR